MNKKELGLESGKGIHIMNYHFYSRVCRVVKYAMCIEEVLIFGWMNVKFVLQRVIFSKRVVTCF